MQRNDPEEVAIAIRDRADLLAQPERIGRAAVRRPTVSNRFPFEAGVAVDAVPVELAQAPERANHVLQLRELQPNVDLVALGAVEVELDATATGGQAAGSGGSVRG